MNARTDRQRGSWRLIDRTSGRVVVARLVLAESFVARLLGWQFRRSLPSGEGLLLVPCRSIHTCFMRAAVDVVFLGEGGRVLAVRRDLGPWRAAVGPRETLGVLEMPAGEAACHDRNALRLSVALGEPDTPTPKSVAFLL